MLLKRVLLSALGRRPRETPAAEAGAAERTPQPGWTYFADGLATAHNADFLRDAKFQESYRLGVTSGQRIAEPGALHIEWRVYVACWAAAHAMRLEGDFVECGVSTGIVSRAVTHYVDFFGKGKRLYLFDTFAGIPEAQMGENERALALSKNRRHYFDSEALVRRHYAAHPEVEIVRGSIPESLAGVAIERVAWLHVDLNIAYPEVKASEHFWPRVVPGGVVLYDDYASLAHRPQKAALDAFAAARGVQILALPTGQGLLLKP